MKSVAFLSAFLLLLGSFTAGAQPDRATPAPGYDHPAMQAYVAEIEEARAELEEEIRQLLDHDGMSVVHFWMAGDVSGRDFLRHLPSLAGRYPNIEFILVAVRSPGEHWQDELRFHGIASLPNVLGFKDPGEKGGPTMAREFLGEHVAATPMTLLFADGERVYQVPWNEFAIQALPAEIERRREEAATAATAADAPETP